MDGAPGRTTGRKKTVWSTIIQRSSRESSEDSSFPDERTGLLSSRNQTPLLMRILRYNSIIHIVGFVAFFALTSLIAHASPVLQHGSFDWTSAAVLVIVLSGTIIVFTTLVPIRHDMPSDVPIRDWKKLYLVLVTKGTNRETVLRSVDEMRHLLQLDSRIRFVVLTEEGRDFDATEVGVDIVFIPNKWQAPHALYKARALEYFRLHQPLRDDGDWVLHLDEETVVDDHCVNTCISFIERSLYEWGQGMILYNTVNYWDNWVLTFGEILRFRDDLGRFQVQHGRLHKTFFGCHGSFLLSSGKSENAATWDTACLAEDFWWGDRAWRLGAGGGFIPAIAREQNNYTYMDFLKQRKRWLRGMCQVPGAYGKLMVLTWVLACFEMPLAALFFFGVVRVPHWLGVWLKIYLASASFTVAFSTLCSDLDAGIVWWRVILHQLLTPLFSIGVQILQTITVLYSLVTPARGFHIVAKGA